MSCVGFVKEFLILTMGEKKMKKILFACALLFSMAFSLLACGGNKTTDDTEKGGQSGHTHVFGEWEIVKKPTSEDSGVKERRCACGEKESETVAKLTESEYKYTMAFELVESGDYREAYALFLELGDYKDSKKEAAKFHYVPTKIVFKETVGDGLEEYQTVTISYNDQNLPIKRVVSYRGIEEYIDEYTYDENLNIIKEVYTTSYGDGNVYDYTYDENENLIKEIFTDLNGKKNVSEYFYNEDSKLAKAVYTNPDGQRSSFIYTYDENGNLIKEDREDSYGTRTSNEYFYDENGNLLEEVCKDAEGVIWKYEYTYDEAGNLIKYLTVYSDGEKEMHETEYDFIYIQYEFTDEKFEELIDRLTSY